jgi:hypothetical protein
VKDAGLGGLPRKAEAAKLTVHNFSSLPSKNVPYLQDIIYIIESVTKAFQIT